MRQLVAALLALALLAGACSSDSIIATTDAAAPRSFPPAPDVPDGPLADQVVTFAGITIEASGGGYLAIDGEGESLATHEAFWFAWSQFYPGTLLWTG